MAMRGMFTRSPSAMVRGKRVGLVATAVGKLVLRHARLAATLY
jgi:hypothetical protein